MRQESCSRRAPLKTNKTPGWSSHTVWTSVLIAFFLLCSNAHGSPLEPYRQAVRRQLQQSAPRTCSPYCAVKCTSALICSRCKGTMKTITSGVYKGQCGCPAGTYFTMLGKTPTCKNCEKGFYCALPGTHFVPANVRAFVDRKACKDIHPGLTTSNTKSTSAAKCSIPLPGYGFNGNATHPMAYLCTGNTYSLGKSSRPCLQCPPGSVINAKNNTDPKERSSLSNCRIPPGYFSPSGDGTLDIQACDNGTYQTSFLALASIDECTSCPEGITTRLPGSSNEDDCDRLVPGYYVAATDNGRVTKAVKVPQGYYSEGDAGADDATAEPIVFSGPNPITGLVPPPSTTALQRAKVVQCPSGCWTKNIGSTNASDCQVPPGFYLSPLSGLLPCEPGTWREGWLQPGGAAAAACSPCGAGMSSDPSGSLPYLGSGTEGPRQDMQLAVRDSFQSCYTAPGYGLYLLDDGSYTVKPCSNNSFGTPDKRYGLAGAACTPCLQGMETMDNNAGSQYMNADKTGYTAEEACVTSRGYGYDAASGSVTRCYPGTYSPGGGRESCRECPTGTSTNGAWSADAYDEDADCRIAPGYGWRDGRIQPCPIGTYNPSLQDDPLAPCLLCPDNTYTEEQGAKNIGGCSLCAPGYGSVSGSPGCTDCALAGGYGPADRTHKDCLPCQSQTMPFTFLHQGFYNAYTSPVLASPLAQHAKECVVQYGQLLDDWFLLGANTPVDLSLEGLTNCLALCTGNCMFATYDYEEAKCYLRNAAGEGSYVVAFKALASDTIGLFSLSASPKLAAVSSGRYTQWLDTNVTGVGRQVQSQADTKATCYADCDRHIDCAGVVMQGGSLDTPDAAITSCKLIRGDVQPTPEGTQPAARSLTRAVPDKIN